MPLLSVKTNIKISTVDKQTLLGKLSSCIASALNKPESYVMVSLNDQQDMLFAGNNGPLAYLELKSLDMPEDQTTEFSALLASELEEQLAIDKSRIYIEFSSGPRHMWGWSGKTF